MSAIEVFKGADGWRYRVKGENGEILAQSEVYASKTHAVRGAATLTKTIVEGQADTSKTFITITESFLD